MNKITETVDEKRLDNMAKIAGGCMEETGYQHQ
jgi:hypothetical protein